ncbi:MAG: DUF4907 domain-containing protein [Bacteroidales bacterium]|nr:DUF4907 domain-containing protein [Bacteroidales bacterium]
MRRLTTIILIATAFATGCASGGHSSQNNAADGNTLSNGNTLTYDTTVQGKKYSVVAQPLDTTDGYSYTISVNGRKFIHQTIIPVVEGFHHFATAEDALNTGKVVVFKMMKTSDLPALTTQDLIMLGILTQDGNIKDNK